MKKFNVFSAPVPCPAGGPSVVNERKVLVHAYWRNDGYGQWSNSTANWKNNAGWSNSTARWKNSDGWSNSTAHWKNESYGRWSNSSASWKNNDGWSNSGGGK